MRMIRTSVPKPKPVINATNFVFPLLPIQQARFGVFQKQAQQCQAYWNWKMMMWFGVITGIIAAPLNMQTVRCDAMDSGISSNFPKTLKYEGDLVISHDIPDNSEIEVTDGSLTIYGNIGSYVSIRFISTQSNNIVINSGGGTSEISIGGGSVFVGSGSVYVNGKKIDPGKFSKSKVKPFVTPKLVFANAGDYFSFEASAAVLKISGKIGEESRIDFTNGSIDIAEIGRNSFVKTVNGEVNVEKICKETRIKTVNGDVTVGEVSGENATVETVNGDITFRYTPPESTRIYTVNGNVSGAKTSGRNKKGGQSVHVASISQSVSIFTSGLNASTTIIIDNNNTSQTRSSK